MVDEHHPKHRMFLFEMRNGRKKLAWGKTPEDALEILRLRLSPEEMAELRPDAYRVISQRDVPRWVRELG